VVDSDGGAGAVLTPRCASWAGLLGHTIKRHQPQHAQVLPTPADMWLLQGLRASLQNSLSTHEAGNMLLQKLENKLNTALLFHAYLLKTQTSQLDVYSPAIYTAQ